MSGLRVALLDQERGGYSRALEAALRGAGHESRLVSVRPVGPVEAVLRRRGFTPGLSPVAGVVLELLRGGFDAAHAFSVPDAAAAHAWRRVTGRPSVFTCTEVLDRATLANGRLRLELLTRAIEESDALTAASEDVRGAMELWLACSPPVLRPDDAAAHERLYGPG